MTQAVLSAKDDWTRNSIAFPSKPSRRVTTSQGFNDPGLHVYILSRQPQGVNELYPSSLQVDK